MRRSDDPLNIGRSRSAGSVPRLSVPGEWPQTLECLHCGQRRLTPSPNDRYHAACRKIVSALDDSMHTAALPRRRFVR
jgi:hypothetical protein